MAVSGLALGYLTVGGLLFWSGVTNQPMTAVLRSAARGKLTGSTTGAPGPATDTGSPVPYPNPVGGQVSSSQLTFNKKVGQMLAASYGWGSGKEWSALNSIVMAESGWNNEAENPSSGAYGIPQALPYTKMPKGAQPKSAGGTSDPAAQISWMLNYIKQTYGDPLKAWAFHQANGWY